MRSTPVGLVKCPCVSCEVALELKRLDPYRWLIPRQGKMRVDGLIFADENLMRDIRSDEAVNQVANVAQFPGIVGRSIGMPDIHWGYGFAIGGVAAFDPDQGGVVSPGGVGYDINCGVRLLRSDPRSRDLRPVPAQAHGSPLRDHPGRGREGIQEVRSEARRISGPS